MYMARLVQGVALGRGFTPLIGTWRVTVGVQGPGSRVLDGVQGPGWGLGVSRGVLGREVVVYGGKGGC